MTDWITIVRNMDAQEIRVEVVDACRAEIAMLEGTYDLISWVPILKRQWDTRIAQAKATLLSFQERPPQPQPEKLNIPHVWEKAKATKPIRQRPGLIGPASLFARIRRLG